MYTEAVQQLINSMQKSEKIPLRKAAERGDTILSKPLRVCLEESFKNLELGKMGIKTDGTDLNDFSFADDRVIVRRKLISKRCTKNSAGNLKGVIKMKVKKVSVNN